MNLRLDSVVQLWLNLSTQIGGALGVWIGLNVFMMAEPLSFHRSCIDFINLRKHVKTVKTDTGMNVTIANTEHDFQPYEM